MKTLGAIYLCWIGIKVLLKARRSREIALPATPAPVERRFSQNFWTGFLTNALDPKVSVFYLAAFPQFIPVAAGSVQSAYVLIFLHILIATIWFGLVVVFTAKIRWASENPSLRRWLHYITGAAFIGFGLKLLTYRANT